MRAPLTIGIDVGGTKLAAGLFDAGGQAVANFHLPPARVGEYEATLDAIAAAVVELQRDAETAGARAEAAGVAVAAFLDADRTRILHAANLDWHERPFGADLQDRLDLPITLANDADAAAWGEYVHGAGTGHASLVLVTLGTGVGGGIVVDDRLVTGAHGLGGELGHLPLVIDGRPCPCGGRGCLEQYASGTALRRAAQDGARARPDGAQRLLALAGNDLETVEGRQIVAAARDGDAVAIGAFDEIGHWLGLAAAHIVALLDPAVLLIGGGLSAAGELILAPAGASYAKHVGIPALHSRPLLRLAQLGPLAGIAGAAALARRQALEVTERAISGHETPAER